MAGKLLAGAVCALVLGGSGAFGAVALIDGEGDDSGWLVSLSTAVTGVSVIDVDLANSEAIISIEKSFGPPSGDMYPAATLSFLQNSASSPTVDRIIVRSESVTNNTGGILNEFTWVVAPSMWVSFNTADSAGWDVSPLTILTWQETDQGGQAARKLVATGGTVPDGGVLTPSGDLVMDITLNGVYAVAFTLKETVVPEPACVVLILAGGAVLVGKGRARRIRRG